VVSFLFLAVLVEIVTIREDKLELLLGSQNIHVPVAQAKSYMQKTSLTLLVLGYLWSFFYLEGLNTTTIAHVVREWYFAGARHRVRSSVCGSISAMFRPTEIVKSTLRVSCTHAGSIAYGSFILAVATMPRILLELLNRQFQNLTDENTCIKLVFRILRCFLWCFQRCLEFVTDYAYSYVAVKGDSFCAAANESWLLMAKRPAQVALNSSVVGTLCFVTNITIPAILALVTWVFVQEVDEFWACLVAVSTFAYVIARIAVGGVYGHIITALFVCVAVDIDELGGRHLTQDLRFACGIPDDDVGISPDAKVQTST